MSITVFPDLVFRHSVISASMRGRQIRKNQRVATTNGYMSVNVVMDKTLREYEFGSIPLQKDDWAYIEQFHEITEGGAYGFLFEDPKDSTVTTAQGVVADVGGGFYQLYKRYTETVSGRYKDRKITRPATTAYTLLVYVNGVNTTYTADPATGRLSITGNPAASTVTWSGRFFVPVHFQSDVIDWTLEVSGPESFRYYSGPTVVFEEIRE